MSLPADFPFPALPLHPTNALSLLCRYTSWFQEASATGGVPPPVVGGAQGAQGPPGAKGAGGPSGMPELPDEFKQTLQNAGLLKNDCVYQSLLKLWPAGLPANLTRAEVQRVVTKGVRSRYVVGIGAPAVRLSSRGDQGGTDTPFRFHQTS